MVGKQDGLTSEEANRAVSASTDGDGVADFADTDVGKAMLSMTK